MSRRVAQVSGVRGVWDKLTEPSIHVLDREARERARTLAAAIVVLLPFATLISFILPAIMDPEIPWWRNPLAWRSALINLFAIVPYFLSRTRHHGIGAYLTVAVAFIGSSVGYLSSPGELQALAASTYFSIVVILSTFLLPIRATGVVYFLCIGILIGGADSAGATSEVVSNALSLVTILGLIVIIATTVRWLEVVHRKQTEQRLEDAEVRLINQQRLESIGTLAAGVAHEISNPLNVMMNAAEIIRRALGDDHELQEFVNDINAEGERVAEIVQNLLLFARHEKKSYEGAELREIVQRTLNIIGGVLRSDQIEVSLDLPEDLPPLICRSQQIQQVFHNLIDNSHQALIGMAQPPAVKKIVIRARRTEDHLTIDFQDSGPGIDPDHVRRVFDPFFTTKEAGQGTGLGLTVVHGIVQEHGGSIKLEASDRGVHFVMRLPIGSDGTNLQEE